MNAMNSLPDYEPRDTDLVPLLPEQIDQAIALSQRVSDPEKRWPVYLNALAIAGFEQWLQEHTTQIHLDLSQCRILEPTVANASTAVYHLQAGGFNLCLVATESLPDQGISLPTIAIDDPEFVAQFYIPISIYEELEQIKILGFLRYDEFVQQRQHHALSSPRSGAYWIPTHWFQTNLDQLLLYLTCLDPTAIPLPSIASTTASTTQAHPLATPLRQLMVQPIVNVGQWFQHQFETATETLSDTLGGTFIEALNWILLPPVRLAGAVRDTLTNLNLDLDPPTEELTRILTSLVRGGMQLPNHSRIAYQDFQLADQAFRLYVMIAPIDPADASDAESTEWSLLAILKSQHNQVLSPTTQLQISDGAEVIAQQTIEPHLQAEYLYSSVIGHYHEHFVVTISLNSDHALTFPPFVFPIQA